jgi:ribosomal protein S25
MLYNTEMFKKLSDVYYIMMDKTYNNTSDKIAQELIERLEKEGRMYISTSDIAAEYNVNKGIGSIALKKFIKYLEQNLDKYVVGKVRSKYYITKRGGQTFPKDYLLGIITVLALLNEMGYSGMAVSVIAHLKDYGVEIEWSELKRPIVEILAIAKTDNIELPKQ